ncbi:MAG: DoxX family membrane protein [Planctomycetes bacterium]|nr:DoxX family membrane protein [Planctomycetota bacterium]
MGRMVRVVGRWLLAVLFVLAGLNHLRDPAFYRPLMPPYLPWHDALIAISGVAQIVGGVGLLFMATRRLAGWWLIALLVAVFPANLHMALNAIQPGAMAVPPWLAWARLPLQAVLIAWVWWVALLVRERGT